MSQPPNFRTVAAAALVAIGLLGAGWFAAQGMAKLRTDDRFVTVKGSAERVVEADLPTDRDVELRVEQMGAELGGEVARARGYDVDKPRNLAKSVTVE